MLLRPLYRWKSLWLGLLVLALLGGGWANSTVHLAEIGWGGSHASGFVNQFGGRMNLRIDTEAGNSTGFRVHHQTHASMNIPTAVMWPSDLRWGIHLRYDPSALVSVSIAHWFLILLVFNCWTAFLLWRVRGMKRLAAGG